MVNDILIKKQYNYTTIKAKKNLAVVKLQGLKTNLSLSILKSFTQISTIANHNNVHENNNDRCYNTVIIHASLRHLSSK